MQHSIAHCSYSDQNQIFVVHCPLFSSKFSSIRKRIPHFTLLQALKKRRTKFQRKLRLFYQVYQSNRKTNTVKLWSRQLLCLLSSLSGQSIRTRESHQNAQLQTQRAVFMTDFDSQPHWDYFVFFVNNPLLTGRPRDRSDFCSSVWFCWGHFMPHGE